MMRRLKFPVVVQFVSKDAPPNAIISRVTFKNADNRTAVYLDTAGQYIFRQGAYLSLTVLVNGELYYHDGKLVAEPYEEVEDCYYDPKTNKILLKSVDFVAALTA